MVVAGCAAVPADHGQRGAGGGEGGGGGGEGGEGGRGDRDAESVQGETRGFLVAVHNSN